MSVQAFCNFELSFHIPSTPRSDLIQARHGTTLHCKFDTEDGNIKATGEKGKVCKFDITIKNERLVSGVLLAFVVLLP